ncbi:hypothetical protein ABL840_26980 [Variovorax sp. NFACC27]|uniref:hypothetical protein n=1 Tax=unclassified Variovorax TaxID=663243 RepID=UPI000898FD27|nr:hypothetical protein SAMN03159371_03653 [Variovorax sp. NFACC28]SEG77766.1 hypothetical protein SAMN03159365_03732 [Variovorax sp. NFACC29]SFC96926.1 hypothetical protein SAMN03159379_03690 [Variovorax sp. NFACC26]SFG09833.1 hypothetical protein SAMN03159447_01799 [Variovorax sp. NFACC27]
MTSILLEVELHLRLPDDAGNVWTVLVAIAKDRHRPRRAAFAPIHPPHAADMHVGDLTCQAWQRLNALNQDLLQLAGGSTCLFHYSSIAS